jgi:hypothetical protein
MTADDEKKLSERARVTRAWVPPADANHDIALARESVRQCRSLAPNHAVLRLCVAIEVLADELERTRADLARAVLKGDG